MPVEAAKVEEAKNDPTEEEKVPVSVEEESKEQPAEGEKKDED